MTILNKENLELWLDNSKAGSMFKPDQFTIADAKNSFSFKVTDEKEAEEIASLFPKYCKVKAHRSVYWNGDKNKSTVSVYFDVSTSVNKVTGEVNETGIKRRNKVFQILEANGISKDYKFNQ